MLGSFPASTRFCVLLTSSFVLLLSGCGFGGADQTVVTSTAAFRGKVHGGPNPVTGATVTLYSTLTLPGSTYGSPGLPLATAVTGLDGSFNFATRLPCPSAGEQAYVTSTGGNPGGPPGTTNPNYVLFAALGNCSDLTTDTFIWVDELSTVAASYALSGFTTTTTLAGNITVNVGAPVNAAATSGSCTNTVATTGSVTTTTVTSCVTAGLKHAFQNAANLVDAVGTFEALPSGQAYASAPSAAGSEVPQALINSLGNALQACVNSSGGAAGDSNPCGRLFTDTTPPGGNAPTNTVDAMINLAKNPTLNTADIYALASPQIFYSPSLLGAPNDFSLAIVYPMAAAGFPAGATMGQFSAIALDSNDTTYTLFTTIKSNNNIYGANTLAATASNGALIYPAFYADPGGPTQLEPRMATDTLGNVWVSFLGNSFINGETNLGTIIQFNAANGDFVRGYQQTPVQSPSARVQTIAVDRQNNVWYGIYPDQINSSSIQTLVELVQSNAYAPASFANVPSSSFGLAGIAIDANQNIWGTTYADTVVFPNTGTAAMPAYGNALIQVDPSYSSNGIDVAIDASGNAWSSTLAGEYENIPTISGATVTTVSTNAVDVGQQKLEHDAVDGAGSVWAVGDGILVKYVPSATSYQTLEPCRVVLSKSLCASISDSPRDDALILGHLIQIDSTGSIWTASGSNSSLTTLTQVIGSGAPTWPQLSYGHPGVMPQ